MLLLDFEAVCEAIPTVAAGRVPTGDEDGAFAFDQIVDIMTTFTKPALQSFLAQMPADKMAQGAIGPNEAIVIPPGWLTCEATQSACARGLRRTLFADVTAGFMPMAGRSLQNPLIEAIVDVLAQVRALRST